MGAATVAGWSHPPLPRTRSPNITTNCVKLVDEVIGRSGTDILSLNGIITPGTYYDYLNREYEKQDSMVVTRRVYARRKFDEQAKQK